MATVDETGVVPRTLTEYVGLLGQGFQSALGSDLDLSEESPQGQIISVLAIRFAETDEALTSIANGFSAARAAGVAQEDLFSPLGVDRLGATRSTVTSTMGGTAGVAIPVNSRVRTAAGDVFRATTAGTIAANGFVDIAMESVATGPVLATIAALTQIIDVLAGWETATNAAAATLGRNIENPADYRARYARSTMLNARTPRQAVVAALLDTTDVTDALVRENATNANVTVQGVAIAARSLYSVVDGGTDMDVARTLADYKTGGGPTTGATTVNLAVLDADGADTGSTVPISFSRVSDVAITVTIPITLGSQFPSDGTTRIIEGVVAYVAGLGISDPVDSTRILVPTLAVPGHMVGTVVIAESGGNRDLTDRTAVLLNEQLTLAATDVTVNLV